jgi:hypothetical protein
MRYFLDNRLTDGGKVDSLTRRTPFTLSEIPASHFCSGLSQPKGTKVRLEGLGQLKNPMTSKGIKPTTFLLAA